MAKAKKTSKKNKPKTTKKRKSAKKTKPSLTKKLFKFGLVVALWGGLILAGILAYYAQELPRITRTVAFERKSSITVKAANGTIIGRYGESAGESIAVDDVPPHLVHAVLATEDRRFYAHFGVDLIGFTRAMVVNVRKGRFVQGGSTITQQLAKNLFLTREKKIKRKIQEAMLAFWLEYELEKDEILSAYLNRVYTGAGTYGMDAAAKRYFNKPVKEVTLNEAAILAGLLKAPSRYSPSSNPIKAQERANVVLASMVNAGYITQDKVNSVKNQAPMPMHKPQAVDSVKYFSDWVVDQLNTLIGTPDEDLIVTTTLDIDAQNTAHAELIKALMKDGDARNIGQGAVVMMGLDGAIKAMVGGRDYGTNQFNRATQAIRPPGSAFKPFVYLTAFENGATLDTRVNDVPVTKGRYRPKNFGHKYAGPIDMYTALVRSSNVIAVETARNVGLDNVIQTARTLGITSALQEDPTVALGSNGLTMLELVTAYAGIANGGYPVEAFGVTKIETEDGDLVYIHDRLKPKQAFKAESIIALKGAMRGVVIEGTGRRAATQFPAAGKTGTSQDSRDAVFAGFSDRMAAVVWVGNDDNTPMKGITGGSTPAGIWRDVMNKTRDIGKPYLDSGFPGFDYMPLETVDFGTVLDEFGPKEINPRRWFTPLKTDRASEKIQRVRSEPQRQYRQRGYND